MAQCIDKRIGDMLFAYELDLLSPEDDQLVELHILNCEHCLRRVKKLTDAVDTIRSDSEAREVIRREDVETEPAGASKLGKQRWPAIIRTLAIATAAVVILLLRPWQIEFHPSHEAVAEGNRIAVMNFRNLAQSDDEVQWGQVMSSLLISDLSETRNLQVVSTQHLMDLARDDQEPSAPPNEERALELAEKAGARWIVEGDILQLKPSPVVVARVVDTRSGTVKSSERVECKPDQSLYAVIDPLTIQIVSCVLQPSLRMGEPDRLITDITSSSPQALQHYLEGLAFRAQFYSNEAIQKFEQAIAADSTFAMAYYCLSRYRTGSERIRLIERANQYSYKAGRRDSLLIASGVAIAQNDAKRGENLLIQITKEFPQEKEPYYDLGNYYLSVLQLKEARRHLNEAIKIDSGYKLAYNALAYVYANLRDSANAMWAIDKYVTTAPNDANVYDSRGDIQLQFGMLEKATESYQKALAIKPDFYSSLRKLGDCFLVSRKYDQADSCYAAMVAAPVQDPYTAEAIWLLALPALRQGDFQRAVSILESNSRLSSKPSTSRYDLYYLRALLLAELGRKPEARSAVDSAIAIGEALQENLPYCYVERVYVLTRIGDLAAADREYGKLKLSGLTPERAELHLPLAQACIQLAKGNYRESRRLLQPILGLTPNSSGRYYFPVRALYARSCLLSGDITTAAGVLDTLVRRPATRRFYWSLFELRNLYYLGLAYEKLGRRHEAVTWYNEFLLFWDNAPLPIAEVQDARERLARLTSET